MQINWISIKQYAKPSLTIVIVQIGPGIQALYLKGRAIQPGERVDQVGAVLGLDVLNLKDPVSVPIDRPALEVAGYVLVVGRLSHGACGRDKMKRFNFAFFFVYIVQ